MLGLKKALIMSSIKVGCYCKYSAIFLPTFAKMWQANNSFAHNLSRVKSEVSYSVKEVKKIGIVLVNRF